MTPNTFFTFADKDSHSLERNHTHFLLLDDGKYHSQYLNNNTGDLASPTENRQSILFRSIEQHQGSMKINREILFYCFLSTYFYRELEY
jgi:hypothetical protein